jgi:hypothetical protein
MRAGSGASPMMVVMVVAVAAMLVTAGSAAAAQRTARPATPANPANEKLEKLDPAERAAVLARAAPNWCIGTETFLMGLETAGAARGNAYWSLRCVDGSTWALQVDPLTGITVIDCDTFKAAGDGKECFKKF